ncbi:hypothetical protein C2W64_01364 [Brevibacillus laterosporus]|nr:hypothetical protein [Brevibacillus laterosporus]RAP26648.1 hypothetical protein C2W64_01364 [Brevibacillus laterosporus]
MNLSQLTDKVTNKANFLTVQDYIDFGLEFLEYIEKNKQALIVSQNETNYNFFQFNKEASYRVSRPFNSTLLFSQEMLEESASIFLDYMGQIKKYRSEVDLLDNSIINKSIYTIQQCIGFALDGLPENQTNTARKLNGDLFEKLIQEIFKYVGVDIRSGIIKVPVTVDDVELFKMNYQHDLIIGDDDNLKLIGSVKTTSKDRIDKVFIDKFLYSKLTNTTVPHIAIFLHDVQRKKNADPKKFGINTTFLSGHFKGYTVKLNPLDGVYYFDPRPNMSTDTLLSKHIQTFDHLICKDIWEFVD